MHVINTICKKKSNIINGFLHPVIVNVWEPLMNVKHYFLLQKKTHPNAVGNFWLETFGV